MYEPTMGALLYLYPKLSIGGYVIIDDYSLPECRRAVEDYRAERGIAWRTSRKSGRTCDLSV